MNRKKYIQDISTIIFNSKANTSDNPICELFYGSGYSRVLLKINIEDIIESVNDKTYADTTKLKHILKLKNTFGNSSIGNTEQRLIANKTKERTSSFTLYLVRMPEQWQSGNGNDFSIDGFLDVKNTHFSENGVNWFNSSTEVPWSTTNGVFTGITSSSENVVASQIFNRGDEDIEMDITSEINNIVSGTKQNNGFMLCFDRLIEETSTPKTQYVAFFTSKSNTFYKPYIETTYSESIMDDRDSFYLDKDNRLYFYSLIGGNYENLDSLPKCFVDSTEYQVKQSTKGVYYIDINIPSDIIEPNTILYDTWTNIVYNGKIFQDVEMEFVVLDNLEYFMFGGNSTGEEERYVPQVWGIGNRQIVNSGQKIFIYINPRIEYSVRKVKYIGSLRYTLYVKESNGRRVEVISDDLVNKTPNANYFVINTSDLLPNKYYVDIEISRLNEVIKHKEKLNFEVI